MRATPKSPAAFRAIYRLGLALFDLDSPERCIMRGDDWIFGPEEHYERRGDVDNVVFPCGYTIAPDGDTVRLYYGAADTTIALATGSVKTMLDWLAEFGKASPPTDLLALHAQ